MTSGPNRPEVLVEIPKFTRIFCCIPLSIGLRIWAFIQILTAIALIIVNMVDLSWSYDQIFTIMLWIANCVWLIDIIFSSLIIYGVTKKNCNIINHTYSYCTAKVVLILIMLVTGGILSSTNNDLWFWYFTFDAFTVYFFIQNSAVGVIAWILHVYFTLLVRSQILIFGGTPKATHRIKLRCVNAEDPVLQGPNSTPSSTPQRADAPPPRYEEVTRDKMNSQPAV